MHREKISMQTSRDALTYVINNHDMKQPERTIALEGATAENAREIMEDGYTVRERLVSGELLSRLRDAADEIAEEAGGKDATGRGARFGGLFVRTLVDKHRAFLDLLEYAPLTSLARYILGPQIQLHASVLRVTYPGQPNQETHWHFHQRVVPFPLPPLFSHPQVLDNLLYLDDTDEATGGLAVVPGTHKDLHRELPAEDTGEKQGQVVLNVPAGTCVTALASLWHRGLPTLPHGRVRRLLIFGYSPTWMKQIDRPGDGLTRALLDGPNTSQETRELLGVAGYY